jgi:hypothetical protein
MQLEIRILEIGLTKYICWDLVNKPDHTVFGNMGMPKANTDRKVAIQDRNAILLDKYFEENKYQWRMINVLL